MLRFLVVVVCALSAMACGNEPPGSGGQGGSAAVSGGSGGSGGTGGAGGGAGGMGHGGASTGGSGQAGDGAGGLGEGGSAGAGGASCMPYDGPTCIGLDIPCAPVEACPVDKPVQAFCPEGLEPAACVLSESHCDCNAVWCCPQP